MLIAPAIDCQFLPCHLSSCYLFASVFSLQDAFMSTIVFSFPSLVCSVFVCISRFFVVCFAFDFFPSPFVCVPSLFLFPDAFASRDMNDT